MCIRLSPSLPRILPLRLLGTAASRVVGAKQPGTLAFEDPRAFRVKSLGELLRALGVFHLCSFPVLVNNCGKVSFQRVPKYGINGEISFLNWSVYDATFDGKIKKKKKLSSLVMVLSFFKSPSSSCLQLMSIARTILGRRGFSLLLRPTVYTQFVAGENESEISQSMEKMSLLGLRPMLAVPIEEDLGESTGYDSASDL